jgi:hypothetical protein
VRNRGAVLAIGALAAAVAVPISLPVLAFATGLIEKSVETEALSEVPSRALQSYQAAAGHCAGLRWELLAGVGWVESGHGTSNGATVDAATGKVSPPIFGPPLDGTKGTRRLLLGRWRGWWGLTGQWMRAVGPMQFLPPTFEDWSVDGDGDGVRDPHDFDDAAATAAHYLCGNDGRIGDEREALLRYNHSDTYVDRVLRYANGLQGSTPGVGTDWVCPVAGRVSFVDTGGAPRPGGRRHEGVDMFAAAGTPVVAPVSGVVDYYVDSIGGLSFRLWGGDGNYYYGTHLSAYGQMRGHVNAATVIGYVGNSGNARTTSPHLHFEFHPGRRPGDPRNPVNPTPLVATYCSEQRSGLGFAGST